MSNYSCTYSFNVFFVFFAIFSSMFWLGVPHIWRPFWIWDLHFLYALKMITVISKLLFFSFSHTHADKQIHKFRFQLMDTFFHCLSFFLGFSSQSNPHLGNFHSWFYIWIVLLLRAPPDNIDTTVSKLLICSSVYIRTAKMSYSKKDIFQLAP